ncbi:putative acyl-coenzyme A synthetase [Cyphellophora attinorum]|uniref:Putative acyl-coenzyme A synthetase n=1 Tax=Cyphellophora attinorum TaxID=1664694 RepID=A0A0N0NII2_9EURO|nr:putative acyl-coenzyme A synthetase [Phialophora attinorum]KPI35469.1 putative acyl-coenzyme A synthetase [Phialophora attinorum]
MPLPSSGTYPLSHKDVVSFTLDEPSYDNNRPVLIDPSDTSNYYTHASARKLVRQLIAGLRAAGLRHGDAVCVHSFNSITYPLLVLAIIGAGGLSVGTNPSYTRHELSHAIKVANVKFVFAEPEIMDNMLIALKDNGVDVGQRFFVFDAVPGQQVPSDKALKSWRGLLDHGEADWIRFDDAQTAKDTVAQLYYTSGTTGLPKCAQTTHQNLVAEHQLFYEAHPRSYRYRVILCMPFFHVGILPQVLVSALKEGREAYVMRRFELESFLRYTSRYQITEYFMVPPMVVSIVMSGLADENSKTYKPEFSMRSVRNGTVGAAPLDGATQKRFQALLAPGATFGQVWGMTETTSMAAIVPWDVSRKQSAGEMDEAWLIDEAGIDVTASGRGELAVKGPTIVKGYYQNEKATRESWTEDGFFKTGDVLRYDHKTRLLYVLERVKELIKVRGFQVAPAELEGVLLEHRDITDAAVIGKKVDDNVELPKAFVVRRPGSTLNESEIHAHMKERLARYKQLEGGISFCESIPKLPSGKILKRVLREAEKGGRSIKL